MTPVQSELRKHQVLAMACAVSLGLSKLESQLSASELAGTNRPDFAADLHDDAAVFLAHVHGASTFWIPLYGHRSEPQMQVAESWMMGQSNEEPSGRRLHRSGYRQETLSA